jgi:parallel beta-helix repeat protein
MRGALIAAAVAAATFAAAAEARTIKVKPGKDAIQKAVNRAADGDRLLVRKGVYRESVIVDKRIRIIGRQGKRPVIDSRCTTTRAVDVVADGVHLEHLRIKGAERRAGIAGYNLNIVGPEGVTVHDVDLRESCNGAYYGVNVANTGPVRLTRIKATGGFEDAGIYVGSIGDLGAESLVIARNQTLDNNVGILVEDSIPAANIVVRDNVTRRNDVFGASDPAGILVRRADGGLYVDNRANGNGDYGIHVVDEGGAPVDNVFIGNRAFGNGVANFLDQGTGTCGSGNSFVLPPC